MQVGEGGKPSKESGQGGQRLHSAQGWCLCWDAIPPGKGLRA